LKIKTLHFLNAFLYLLPHTELQHWNVENVTPAQVGRYMCPINPSKQDVEQGMSHSTIYIYIIQIEYTYHLFWFRWKTTALFELYFLLLIDDVTLSFSIFV